MCLLVRWVCAETIRPKMWFCCSPIEQNIVVNLSGQSSAPSAVMTPTSVWQVKGHWRLSSNQNWSLACGGGRAARLGSAAYLDAFEQTEQLILKEFWRKQNFIHPVLSSLHSAFSENKMGFLMLLSAPRISFFLSSLWKYHHPSSDKFLYQSCWCLSWGLAGLRQGWEHLGSLCICLGVPLKHVWGVWVTNEFVCSVCLVSTGPTCVDRASTRTAVQAGRLCREGTSALFVSDFFVCVECGGWPCVFPCRRIRLRTPLWPALSSYSNLQEFMRRWLLLQTQHVHLFQRSALSQLWIRSRKSVTYIHSVFTPTKKQTYEVKCDLDKECNTFVGILGCLADWLLVDHLVSTYHHHGECNSLLNQHLVAKAALI